jgi:uncharacterized protein (DUF2147 family)
MGHVSCTIAAATVGVFCVAGVASAQDRPNTPPELEGRWAAQHRQLVLDISRCGKGWCGVEVLSGATCGKTVLRFEITKRENDEDESLRGLLQLAAEARSYSVEVSYFMASGGDSTELLIQGMSGRTFDPWRRSYPFTEVLISAGPAQCRAQTS